jgi:hypothetical protein
VDHAVFGFVRDRGSRGGNGRERLGGRSRRVGDVGGRYRGDQHRGLGFRHHLDDRHRCRSDDGLRCRGDDGSWLGLGDGNRLDRSGHLGDDRCPRGGRFGLGLAGFLGGGLLVRLGLFGLYIAPQPLALSLAAGAVGLRLLDARRMALYADTERDAQIECFLVGQAELFC